MIFARSLLDARVAKSERIRRSGETEASSASLLAMRDWLALTAFARFSTVRFRLIH